MPKEMHDRITARMRRLGITNFSDYMRIVLKQDLEKGGDLVIQEKESPAPAPSSSKSESAKRRDK